MNKEKLETAKTVITFVTGLGVTCLVNAAAKKVIPADAKTVNKLLLAIGAGTIGAWLSDQTSEYVRDGIDEMADDARAILVEDEPIPVEE